MLQIRTIDQEQISYVAPVNKMIQQVKTINLKKNFYHF